MDLHLSISHDFVSSKIYDKRDDFGFDIVIFPFLDGDSPRRPSYGMNISQLIRFARECSHVDDFTSRNKCLTAKLLKQGYRYYKLRKTFSKFYCRHHDISQLIKFARECSHVDDFNSRSKCLTAKLLKQGYRYHKLRKALFQVLSPTP